MKFLFSGLALLATASLLPGQATLHIGFGAGTACAMGCAGDPNLSGPVTSVVDIFQNSGGARSITNPSLILAVPNDTTNLGFTISSETDINPYPGGTSTVGSGTFTSFTSGFHSGSVYTAAGLGGGPGSASDSFANMTAAETAHTGISATSFGVYVFSLSTTLDKKGLANVQFSSALPKGTFAFGYGTTAGDEKVKIYDTPFTESGLFDSGTTPAAVPEPSAVLLLFTGLAIAIPVLHRRLQRRNIA